MKVCLYDIMLFRVRDTFDNIKSQTGVFYIFENAVGTGDGLDMEIRVRSHDRVSGHAHSPKAIEHLMGPLPGEVSVIGQVDHQHFVVQFLGIVRQNTGKEKLLIIAMGRKQDQIRFILFGKIPALDKVRNLA